MGTFERFAASFTFSLRRRYNGVPIILCVSPPVKNKINYFKKSLDKSTSL